MANHACRWFAVSSLCFFFFRFGLMKPTSHAGAQRVPHVLFDYHQIEPFRVEMPAAPSQHFSVFRIFRIRNYPEEILIAGLSANIFGRTRASACNACCVLGCDPERELGFDLDDVIPTVPEIVTIPECNAPLVRKIRQPDFTLIEQAGIQIRPAVVFDFEIAVTQSADLKFMEMIIPPIERSLDRKMQLMQVPAEWNDEPSPDRRRYACDLDPNLSRIQFFEWHGESFRFRGFPGVRRVAPQSFANR